MKIKQRTIKQSISIKGIGLHSGVPVKLTLRPAPSNTGIVFRRTDIDVDFFPSPETVRGTQLCTQIFAGKHSINTVEHINAALSACGIDNIIIEVDNIEIPILDGSSIMFLWLLTEAGIEELNADKQFILTKRPLIIQKDDKFVKLKPHHGLFIDFTIDFTHPFIRSTKNNWSGEITLQTFATQISRARTFGFMKDIELLQQNGLCLGGSLDNAIVLDEFRVLNKDELRYPDEFVRHKVLDSVGDLFVVGRNILTHFTAYKSGHELNNLALQAILKSENSEVATFNSTQEIENVLKFDLKNYLPENLLTT